MDSFLNELTFTAIDLETTGLIPGKSEIIEIAGVKFNHSGVIETFSSLVKPFKELSQVAQKINGITEEMLENAPPLTGMLQEFLKFIDGSVLIIQNSDFDLGFLMYESGRRNIAFPDLPVFCTVQLSRKHYPDFKKYNLHFLRIQFGVTRTFQKFDEASHFHEALDDSYAAMEVFRACAEKGGLWSKTCKEAVQHSKGYLFTSDYSENFRFA